MKEEVEVTAPEQEVVIEKAVFSFASAKENMAGKQFREVIGRRKTSTARVRVMLEKKSSITVNGKDIAEYIDTPLYLTRATAPLKLLDIKEGLAFTVVVNGGGKSSQADAILHGISRALVFLDPSIRTQLKRAGYLKRDPRKKERKKPGLKKARKASQWSKR